MKVREALIAWNPGTDQVRVGPLLHRGDVDWTDRPVSYWMTGGAAEIKVRKFTGIVAQKFILSEFMGIVVRDGVDLLAAHNAFLVIDEYRDALPPDMSEPLTADSSTRKPWPPKQSRSKQRP